MSSTVGIGAALGLPLAALIVQYADWHAMFWATSASGAIGVAGRPGGRSRESPVRSPGRFDALGRAGAGRRTGLSAARGVAGRPVGVGQRAGPRPVRRRRRRPGPVVQTAAIAARAAASSAVRRGWRCASARARPRPPSRRRSASRRGPRRTAARRAPPPARRARGRSAPPEAWPSSVGRRAPRRRCCRAIPSQLPVLRHEEADELGERPGSGLTLGRLEVAAHRRDGDSEVA